MKKFFIILSISLTGLLFISSVPQVNAQVGQIWETIIGQPRDDAPGDDGLTPGVFRPPFKCGLTYAGSTYPAHSDYSVDFNRGVVDLGDPIRASANGRVSYIYLPNGQVHITHAGGYETVYAHMQKIQVRTGDTVRLGEQIGEIGNVGQSTGPHLHVNHLKNGNRIKVSYNGVPYPASLPTGASRAGPLVRGFCP